MSHLSYNWLLSLMNPSYWILLVWWFTRSCIGFYGHFACKNLTFWLLFFIMEHSYIRRPIWLKLGNFATFPHFRSQHPCLIYVADSYDFAFVIILLYNWAFVKLEFNQLFKPLAIYWLFVNLQLITCFFFFFFRLYSNDP